MLRSPAAADLDFICGCWAGTCAVPGERQGPLLGSARTDAPVHAPTPNHCQLLWDMMRETCLYMPTLCGAMPKSSRVGRIRRLGKTRRCLCISTAPKPIHLRPTPHAGPLLWGVMPPPEDWGCARMTVAAMDVSAAPAAFSCLVAAPLPVLAARLLQFGPTSPMMQPAATAAARLLPLKAALRLPGLPPPRLAVAHPAAAAAGRAPRQRRDALEPAEAIRRGRTLRDDAGPGGVPADGAGGPGDRRRQLRRPAAASSGAGRRLGCGGLT